MIRVVGSMPMSTLAAFPNGMIGDRQTLAAMVSKL
jgi:hypothetical protein